MEFEAFKKIPRIEKLNHQAVITEKIDGTNGCVAFDDEGVMHVGSRNRWLDPNGGKGADNFGFAAWARAHEEELRLLGPGRHYGEWYGLGIGMGYGLTERRFALFNTRRWGNPGQTLPACLGVVPVLWDGRRTDVLDLVEAFSAELNMRGSRAVPGWMRPEGMVVYFPGFDATFKVILNAPGATRKERPSPIESVPVSQDFNADEKDPV